MLSIGISIGMFLVLLVVLCFASIGLTNGLEKIDARLRFPEALLGIFTAFGADAPEIASAIAALNSNYHDVALGVVLGSNIFNFAGLLGVSAMVAGRVKIRRRGLLINGGVGLLATVAIAALILVWISAGLSLVVLAMLLGRYCFVSSLQAPQIKRLRLPDGIKKFLGTAVEHAHHNAKKRDARLHASMGDAIVVIFSLGLIVASSAALVHIAVALASAWGVSHAVVGTLILATLTSIPNLAAAAHLARAGRGAAVVSETFNSNTINALVGICLPAFIFGLQQPSKPIEFSVIWLIGMSLVAIVATSFPKGLHRLGGAVIIGLYIIFAGVIVFWQ